MHASAGDRVAMVACMTAALISAVAATLVARTWWIAFFAHPAVESNLTEQGVTLWRTMLGVMAIALPAGWWMLRRLQATSMRMDVAADSGRHRTSRTGLLGLIALALALRAMRINESLWYDEIASWRTYNGGVGSFGATLGAFLDPINHTLHTLLNRWSVEHLFPTLPLEMAFRLPALLFSIMTVPVMFGLGRAATGSERIGWIAATLAAIAPVCVLEGVEARGYAQMIFFSAAATWTFILAFRSGHAAMWLLYALCCMLGVWSHFVTAWVAIGHGAWLMWRALREREDRGRCAQGFIALALGGLLSITAYSPLIPGLLAWRSNFAATSASQPRIFGPEGWHAVLQLGGSWSVWAAIAGAAMFGLGILRVLRRKRLEDSSQISSGDALTLALVGLPLMLLAVAVGGTWLYARFMLFGMPGALLAMAIGVDALWHRKRGLGIAALALIVASSLVDLWLRPAKQPLRESVEYVRDRQQPGDRVLAVGLAHDVLSVYGYDVEIAESFMFGRDLEQKLDAVRPRWVIVEYPRHVPADRYELLEARGYVKVAHLPGWADWGHGDVLVFELGGDATGG